MTAGAGDPAEAAASAASATRARQQRVRVRQARLVLYLDLSLVAVAWIGVALGVLEAGPVALWSAVSVIGALAFVLIIRSGANLRFTAEPSLTMPQAVWGVTSAVIAYLVTGPVRGATLLSVALAIIFGMFALTSRQVLRLCAFAIAMLGCAMLLAARSLPMRFPPREEAMHFLMVSLMLPVIGVLTVQLSTMRKKMRDQRVALEEALARNFELASHDDLTGLRNRRSILELVDIEARRSRREGSHLSFAILDIDFFKQVNDTHGHAGGDEVLKGFANMLTGTLRESDLVARWGGEEFLIVLPATTKAVAHVVLQRLRFALETVPLEIGGTPVAITFSGGVAQSADEESVQQTIERADQALYAAKGSGRDKTVG